MKEPLWALAAGCIPDALPWDIPKIAYSSGFKSSGMWVDPSTSWNGNALKKTKKAINETGIELIDVEVVWLEKSNKINDKQKLILDVALELEARNILIVSRHDNYEDSILQFRDICEWVGNKIKVCLEFGEFTKIKTLEESKQFVKLVDHNSAGILIDLMHLNRSGEEIPNIEDNIFPYIQVCDFYQNSSSMTGIQYIEAALDNRYCLGEGEAKNLDISRICNSSKDISLEIRSLNLRENYPDPYLRAKEIFRRCIRDEFINSY